MRQLMVDESEQDSAYVEKFAKELEMLTGIVHELLVDEPRMILSPVMRQLLIDKAKSVKALFGPMKGRIHVDNPSEPLKPWNE